MGTSIRSRKKSKKKQGKVKGGKVPPAAKTADRYELYQRAVNSPDNDVDFLFDTYRAMRRKKPRHLREDFCGTAALAAEWLRRGKDLSAEGFDIDPEPVDWGYKHNFEPLGEAAARMTFHLKDVREPSQTPPDVRTAPNFSYWLFMTRKELLAYFASAREDLAPNGIFVIDLYGGPEAMCEMEETRKIGGGVTYVWDQREYWPGTGEYECAIHFRFKDGSEMRSAFEYRWRFWHLTELKDLLLEAGFATVDGYFEGTDPDDETQGDGNFEKDLRGENCEAWIAYLVAGK